MPYYAVTAWTLRRQSAICCVLTAALCGLIWLTADVLLAPYRPAPPAEQACLKMPTVEGAMTVLAMLDGKIVCWRWQ